MFVPAYLSIYLPLPPSIFGTSVWVGWGGWGGKGVIVLKIKNKPFGSSEDKGPTCTTWKEAEGDGEVATAS